MTSILIIEDDFGIRISMMEVLALHDFTFFEAGDGLKGLELAKKTYQI